jgi:hypothetical protein
MHPCSVVLRNLSVRRKGKSDIILRLLAKQHPLARHLVVPRV